MFNICTSIKGRISHAARWLEAFETALLNSEGAILAISHDSTFIEKIATEEWILKEVS